MRHCVSLSFTWMYSQLLCHVFWPNLWDGLNMSLSCWGEITCRTKVLGHAFLALPSKQALQGREPQNSDKRWSFYRSKEVPKVPKMFFPPLPPTLWDRSGISDLFRPELGVALLIEIIGSHTGPQNWILTGTGSS